MNLFMSKQHQKKQNDIFFQSEFKNTNKMYDLLFNQKQRRVQYKANDPFLKEFPEGLPKKHPLYKELLECFIKGHLNIKETIKLSN